MIASPLPVNVAIVNASFKVSLTILIVNIILILKLVIKVGIAPTPYGASHSRLDNLSNLKLYISLPLLALLKGCDPTLAYFQS